MKFKNCIVIACEEFVGAHKHLPGIFNDIHCTLSRGGETLVTPVKLVISNMHYRGMEFGGAHVWKMGHPQAMDFFCYVPSIVLRGAPTLKLGLFFILCLKLHENEIIWTRGHPWHPTLQQPMLVVAQAFAQKDVILVRVHTHLHSCQQ